MAPDVPVLVVGPHGPATMRPFLAPGAVPRTPGGAPRVTNRTPQPARDLAYLVTAGRRIPGAPVAKAVAESDAGERFERVVRFHLAREAARLDAELRAPSDWVLVDEGWRVKRRLTVGEARRMRPGKDDSGEDEWTPA